MLPVSTGGQLKQQEWSDVDWETDHSQCRSRTSFVVQIIGATVTCSSKLQTATEQSTTEAEFGALASCVRELQWLRDVLDEIGLSSLEPTHVLQDNLGSISWTKFVHGLCRVNNFGINYHAVRAVVESGNIDVAYTSSVDHRADCMTKALVNDTFINSASGSVSVHLRGRPDLEGAGHNLHLHAF